MPDGCLIDHIVLAADSLDRAAERYAALGFTLTPRAFHDDRMGTSNRLVQFAERNFIELLEVDRPEGLDDHVFDAVPPRFSFGAHNRAFLQEREGMSMLVLASRDARADHRRLEQLGLDTYEPFHFERKARLPDGAAVTVAFTLAFATSAGLPGLGFFFCQQHAPEYFWKAEYQSHANGARGIAAVYIAAAEPASHVDFLAKLTGWAVAETDGGGHRLANGGQEILVMTPAEIRAALPGCGLPDQAAPRFAGVAIRASIEEPRVVAAERACGLLLEWRRS